MRLLATQRNYRAYLDPSDQTCKYPTSLKEIYETRKGSLDGNWSPFLNDEYELRWRQDSLNPFYNNATNFFPMYYETAKITNANIQAYGGTLKRFTGTTFIVAFKSIRL